VTVSLFAIFDFFARRIEEVNRAKHNVNPQPNPRRLSMTNKIKDFVLASISAIRESIIHGGMGMALVSF
jgi:hypothetical protein